MLPLKLIFQIDLLTFRKFNNLSLTPILIKLFYKLILINY